jgi:Na+-transporting NADH:ubiquinone oxidoreductase subunit NqrB
VKDPRYYQIAILTSLLVYGIIGLDFEVVPIQAAATLSGVLVVQFLLSHWMGIRWEWRSALISGLSLCLLCRTRELGWCLAGATIAIGSKFVFRYAGKHLFNPTNLALIVLLLVSDGRVWVSPGQWGSVAFFAVLMACVGGLVVMRAGRWDVAIGFLLCWALLLIGRSWWVHEPLTIPLHRLQNGALLLFTFFMISDPKTTPNSRAGRFLFAAMVATGGWWWQFLQFGTNGPLWALAAISPLVPVINRLLPGPVYQWPSLPPNPAPSIA